MARASILWLIGEYCERVPKIAPDVLRKMAKSFTSEEDLVKLQAVNLAAKLYLTNSKQVSLVLVSRLFSTMLLDALAITFQILLQFHLVRDAFRTTIIRHVFICLVLATLQHFVS